MIPRPVEDAFPRSFEEFVPKMIEIAKMNVFARIAFLAEMREEIVVPPVEDYWVETEAIFHDTA